MNVSKKCDVEGQVAKTIWLTCDQRLRTWLWTFKPPDPGDAWPDHNALSDEQVAGVVRVFSSLVFFRMTGRPREPGLCIEMEVKATP